MGEPGKITEESLKENFPNPRSIDFHVRAVLTKYGISMNQLIDLLLDDDIPEPWGQELASYLLPNTLLTRAIVRLERTMRENLWKK